MIASIPMQQYPKAKNHDILLVTKVYRCKCTRARSISIAKLSMDLEWNVYLHKRASRQPPIQNKANQTRQGNHQSYGLQATKPVYVLSQQTLYSRKSQPARNSMKRPKFSPETDSQEIRNEKCKEECEEKCKLKGELERLRGRRGSNTKVEGER